jgi:hypothetical protein
MSFAERIIAQNKTQVKATNAKEAGKLVQYFTSILGKPKKFDQDKFDKGTASGEAIWGASKVGGWKVINANLRLDEHDGFYFTLDFEDTALNEHLFEASGETASQVISDFKASVKISLRDQEKDIEEDQKVIEFYKALLK